MTDHDAILDAGGLLIPSKSIKGDDIDSLSARSYRHPALTEPIVRLTSDNLAQGDDLEMEFLGFESPEVTGPLALRRRQALGFPGWALIHDPKHARYALEIVKTFKKNVRLAHSKPGHALDGFTAIAKQLGRSVAHFLPSFWEQVGREFMQLENSTYASRAFGKAREAERVHALTVDEDLRREAFLEFALNGCLTIKSLTTYGKDLQATLPPVEAWKCFSELCIRRTLGGMPPWASMARELDRLLKATDLDAAAEARKFLEEIIDAPAIARAAPGFWKSYKRIVAQLVSDDSRAAGILLNLKPDTSAMDFYWIWLDYLGSWGLLENLWKSKVPAEAQPQGGPGAWFSRMVQVDSEMPQPAFDLLRKMAAVIKKEGKPLNLACKASWGNEYSIDVDLLDLALELGITVADPPDGTTFDLREWASTGEGDTDRPRDVVHVHADERFADMLRDAVGQAAGDAEFEKAAKGKSSLFAARKSWVLNKIVAISNSALPTADTALQQLCDRTSRHTSREFPTTFKMLKEASPDQALVKTLRNGLFDEFGWLALEEAAARLAGEGAAKAKAKLTCFGGAPHAILTNGVQAIVVDADKIIYEHEIRLPKKASLEELCFNDGHLSVHYRTDNYDHCYYWSHQPKKQIKEVSWRYSADPGGWTISMPGSGTFNGTRTIHAGDAKSPELPRTFFSDGEHFWRADWESGEEAVREIDPRNGDKGRRSLPAFFEDFVTPETELVVDACTLMHLGSHADRSPLGSSQGLVGWRVRKSKTNTDVHGEGIDGRRWDGYLVDGFLKEIPIGVIRFPGSSEMNAVSKGGWQDVAVIWDSEGKTRLAVLEAKPNEYSAGQDLVLPLEFWHLLRPRDEATSRKLRETTLKQANALMNAGLKDAKTFDFDGDNALNEVAPHTTNAVNKWLPDIASPRLRRGIVLVAVEAALMSWSLSMLISDRDPEGRDEFVEEDLDGDLIRDACRSLGLGYSYGDGTKLFPHVQAVGRFFATGQVPAKLPEAPFLWSELLDGIEARLWRVYCAPTDEKTLQGVLKFTEKWIRLPLHELPGAFRQNSLEFDKNSPFHRDDSDVNQSDEWIAHVENDNRYLLNRESWDDSWAVLEYAPNGEFRPLTGAATSDETTLVRGRDNQQLGAFLTVISQREPPLPSQESMQAAADRLGMSRAEVALIWCGFPKLDSWEKNFLPKPLREQLGLKVNEADAARQALKAIRPDIRQRLLMQMLSGDPNELWSETALDRLVAAWASSVPKRLTLPAELIDQFDDMLGYECELGEVLEAFADPHNHPAMQANDTADISQNEHGLTFVDEHVGFNRGTIHAVAAGLPVFFHELPVGDPARELMAETYDATIELLKHEGLLFALRSDSYFGDEEGMAPQKLETIVGKLRQEKKTKLWVYDEGPILAKAVGDEFMIGFRPAKVNDSEQLATLLNISKAAVEEDYGTDAIVDYSLLISDGYQSLRRRLSETPVPEGKYEANPLHSAAELVAEVAETKSIGEHAAMLYLQTLALPDPTTKNVKLWNDWTTGQYNKATKELAGAKLVLQAKRSRAGRSFFLHGGWEPLKRPNLPTETWKLPLWNVDRDSAGNLEIPLTLIYCLRPIHETFAVAWQRIVDGDEPKYEEVS